MLCRFSTRVFWDQILHSSKWSIGFSAVFIGTALLWLFVGKQLNYSFLYNIILNVFLFQFFFFIFTQFIFIVVINHQHHHHMNQSQQHNSDPYVRIDLNTINGDINIDSVLTKTKKKVRENKSKNAKIYMVKWRFGNVHLWLTNIFVSCCLTDVEPRLEWRVRIQSEGRRT